jgi:hypothetical protein
LSVGAHEDNSMSAAGDEAQRADLLYLMESAGKPHFARREQAGLVAALEDRPAEGNQEVRGIGHDENAEAVDYEIATNRE